MDIRSLQRPPESLYRAVRITLTAHGTQTDAPADQEFDLGSLFPFGLIF